jgi:exopolyphosphatase / guanosine-5'-triphosphate,3'-diphosphate pyrophosphatase
MQDGTLLAAVDLGSNSFRLEIGQLRAGHVERVEYLKETVRLGAGLGDDKNLSDAAIATGMACLARFGERLRGFDAPQVRAVATQTLREARNAQTFVAAGQQALGFPIAVVSGTEEARLIYQGVSRLLPPSEDRRLVIDIGGRSTEFVIGQGYEARSMASFRLGSVSWSSRYFAKGDLSARNFEHAMTAAQAILDEGLDQFAHSRWDCALGASGTVSAVTDLLNLHRNADGVIRRDDLRWLLQRLIKSKHIDQVDLTGLKPDRRPVIGGGVSILMAIFDLFGIDELTAAQGALRQGALYDLIERDDDQTDVRERTVKHLQQRFQVDLLQAQRVCDVAQTLFTQVAKANKKNQRYSHKLRWTAMLHEIGTLISHIDAPDHGAYLLAHVDASGFSLDELARMSELVRAQRGKLKKVEHLLEDELFAKQLFSLRLATLLCHSRRTPELGSMQCQHTDKRFELSVTKSWAAEHPQSMHLLQSEAAQWQKSNWLFELKMV